MKSFLALAIVALTLPLWGGALAALVGGAFFLVFHNPLLLVALVGGLFFLGSVA
jgi:hypothetical protein